MFILQYDDDEHLYVAFSVSNRNLHLFSLIDSNPIEKHFVLLIWVYFQGHLSAECNLMKLLRLRLNKTLKCSCDFEIGEMMRENDVISLPNDWIYCI